MNTRVLSLALLAFVATACDRRRGFDDPIGQRVEEATPRIEKVAGLKFKTPPKFELRTRDQVRDFLLKKFDEATPAEELRGQEAAYKAFGLIPDTLDLRHFLLDLLTEQIVGYYDPETKVLYVVKEAPADMTGVTISHELVHALQDQYVNMDSIQKAKGNSDRQAAAQAALEGHATWVQLQEMLDGADLATRMPGGWDQIREQIRENQRSMPKFANAPMAIQEALIFPYLSGAEFVRRFQTRGDKRNPIEQLPVSTEQILSEDAYFGAKPNLPVRVTLPGKPGAGEYEEVMGEFGTRLFLFQHSKDNQSAVNGAHGWGGDRYRVMKTAKGRAVVWVTAWDTPIDAAQFVDALGQAIVRRYATGGASTSTSGTRTYEGRGRIVVVTPRETSSGNLVMMVDVPAGTSTALLDMGSVRVVRE